MKRIILSLATAAGLSLMSGVATADPGGYVPPTQNGGGSMPSWAQMAGPNTLLGAGDLPPGRAPDRYGLHPCLKKFFHVPSASTIGPGGYGNPHNPLQNPANWAAAGYGMGGPAYNPNGFPPAGGGGYPGMPGGNPGMMGMGGPGGMGQGYPGMGGAGGPMMQGTLVFPYNNMIRSPRDYFMVDVNKQ